jgi:hypothetical protein
MSEEDFVDKFTGFVVPFEELKNIIGYPMVQIIGRYGHWEIQEEDRLVNYVLQLRKERNMTVCDYD